MGRKGDRTGEVVNNLIGMFESREMPAAIAQTLIRRAQSDAPSSNWSICNQLLMWFSGTHDARGYKQWESVGRKVKPKEERERDVFILAPLRKKIVEEDTEEERTIVYGFKTIRLFRVEDTTGEEVIYPEYKPMTLPPLWDVGERLGIDVSYQPFTQGFRGAYAPGANAIILATHDVVTWFHELAHAAHGTIETLTPGQNPRQEIIAETVAATLCILYGVDGYVPRSFDYIQSYAGTQKPAQAVASVLGTVQKVLDKILEGSEG